MAHRAQERKVITMPDIEEQIALLASVLYSRTITDADLETLTPNQKREVRNYLVSKIQVTLQTAWEDWLGYKDEYMEEALVKVGAPDPEGDE
jgi:hypothetical protein